MREVRRQVSLKYLTARTGEIGRALRRVAWGQKFPCLGIFLVSACQQDVGARHYSMKFNRFEASNITQYLKQDLIALGSYKIAAGQNVSIHLFAYDQKTLDDALDSCRKDTTSGRHSIETTVNGQLMSFCNLHSPQLQRLISAAGREAKDNRAASDCIRVGRDCVVHFFPPLTRNPTSIMGNVSIASAGYGLDYYGNIQLFCLADIKIVGNRRMEAFRRCLNENNLALATEENP